MALISKKKCKFQRSFCGNYGRHGTFGDRACRFFVSCFEGGSQAENTAHTDVFVVSRFKNVVFQLTLMFVFCVISFACASSMTNTAARKALSENLGY